MQEYRYIGTYPTTDANGAPLEPGGTVEFDPESHSNDSKFYKVMLDEGVLVSTAEDQEPESADAEEPKASGTSKAAGKAAKDKEG